jgi:hypothetical protein
MIFVLALVAGLVAGSGRAQETSLTPEERAKLDTFEGVSIDRADKIFTAKEWPRAVAEYDAFIVQFPESKVTPYAILRKGRALQETQKRCRDGGDREGGALSHPHQARQQDAPRLLRVGQGVREGPAGAGRRCRRHNQGHSSRDSSPIRAISFAHAIRDVSWERGFWVA